MMYLQTTILALAVFTASTSAARTSGCGKELPAIQRQLPTNACVDSYLTSFKQSNSVQRSYRIHLPSNYNKNQAIPLIFSFHGHNKTACGQEQLSEFSDARWNPDAIAVYPQGLDRQWQGDPNSHGVDDLGFVDDMIGAFSNLYCIDDSRIYAAGKSNGGGFTGGILACDPILSTKIAAFAPVSGAFYVPGSSSKGCEGVKQSITITCKPGRKDVPILEFHGGADNVIHYSGGGRRGECLPTIPHWVREWSKREGFGLTNLTTLSHNGKVLKYEYGGAQGKLGIVTHYYIDGLGHDWPSTVPNRDNPSGHTYLNATPIIMEFFNKYTLSGAARLYEVETK